MSWVAKAETEAQQITNLVNNLELGAAAAEKSTSKTKSVPEEKRSTDGDKKEEQVDEANPADTSLLLKIIRKGLIDTDTSSIEVQRKDPSSPLFSVKSFEELHLKKELLKGIYTLGYNKPSKIQESALPTLLADPPQNMIAQSQSGTGKTAAFVLAMLSRVNPDEHYPQVLCLSPTYELAIQTGEVAARMGQFCPEIQLKFAVRGEEVQPATKITEHIIIGTPGKILDWSLKYKVIDLKKIKVFVLDEADVMIATQGHHDQCIRIHKQLSRKCQMLFFSATYNKDVMDFAQHIVPEPLTLIRLKREQESLDNIKQYQVRCSSKEEKYNAIQNIYGAISVGQCIVFCHTRKSAGWLAGELSKDGHSVAILSGELTVEQRLAVLDRFRAGYEKILITTNVLSRGIDVEQVTFVVNFDMPMDLQGKADCETYLHRIGRTGRFGKSGIAINLIDSEKAAKICNEIEKHFGKKILPLNTDNSDEIENIGS